MALVGAPAAHEDHALRAVLAALGLRRRLAEGSLASDGLSVHVQVRMGLDSGRGRDRKRGRRPGRRASPPSGRPSAWRSDSSAWPSRGPSWSATRPPGWWRALSGWSLSDRWRWGAGGPRWAPTASWGWGRAGRRRRASTRGLSAASSAATPAGRAGRGHGARAGGPWPGGRGRRRAGHGQVSPRHRAPPLPERGADHADRGAMPVLRQLHPISAGEGPHPGDLRDHGRRQRRNARRKAPLRPRRGRPRPRRAGAVPPSPARGGARGQKRSPG